MAVDAPAARALAVTLLAASLAACASTDPAVDIVNGRTADDVYVPSRRTSLAVGGAGRQPVGTAIGDGRLSSAKPAPGTSRALDPDNPWFGEVGLSHSTVARTEVGLGLAVPNSYLTAFRPIEPQDRARSLGVGVWWKFEF